MGRFNPEGGVLLLLMGRLQKAPGHSGKETGGLVNGVGNSPWI